MIIEPGHPTGSLVISVERGHPMLKTISAALLAVSVLAAPAMAGTATPAMAGTVKTTHAPAVKSAHIKASVLNAQAHMGRHHHHHSHFRHHRFHKR